jgi:hypothetical protein
MARGFAVRKAAQAVLSLEHGKSLQLPGLRNHSPKVGGDGLVPARGPARLDANLAANRGS